MPPLHSQPPSPRTLTLIVATTPVRVPTTTTTTTTTTTSPPPPPSQTRLGIGHNGTLPWPRIKADMSFFARVTSRPPARGQTNAIIMGRKTYESLPRQLRPLKERINVVVTRDGAGAEGGKGNGRVKEAVLRELEAQLAKRRREREKQVQQKRDVEGNVGPTTTTAGVVSQEEEEEDQPITAALVASSMQSALDLLETTYGQFGKLGNIFVIGGAEIYAAALQMQQMDQRPRLRIVMTNVVRKRKDAVEADSGDDVQFQCDTFFPEENLTPENGWRVASAGEVTHWVGEEVSSEWKEEGDMALRMVGYERI